MQQLTSVADYLAKFEDLLNEMDGQSEETLITYFIGGLRPDVKNELKIVRSTSLQQAFATTKMYESHLGHCPGVAHTTYCLDMIATSQEPLIETFPPS